MRFLTYSIPSIEGSKLGLFKDGQIFSSPRLEPYRSLDDLLRSEIASTDELNTNITPICKFEEATIFPPLLRPSSLRDFYAFEQHVTTANNNRGRNVPSAWYEIPVFYFSNPYAVFGHNQEIPTPKYTQALDFELEVGCIIGKSGINIKANQAMDYVFGFTIFNDWSARDVQKKEMSVGLGPAKGKDFASSFGPWVTTPDDLFDRSHDKPGVYDLEMTAKINGEIKSNGNWKELYYSFGEMIERASEEVALYPGDIIGSGTVGTGCLLELTKNEGPWLKKGDVVELEIERLGVLRNTIN